jgi:glyoxalase family protein
MKALNGLHHITLCVGDKQEDYEFHTKILGLRSVKKTLLYDGKVPIYHLYYGNADGDPGSIVTSFPMRHTGIKGTLGNNQIQGVMLAIPEGARDFWAERLTAHDIAVTAFERFGEKRLDFKHPVGIAYTLVETDAMGRRAYGESDIPTDKGIVGMHGITVNVREIGLMDEFMQSAWSSELVAEEGACRRYQMGKGGSGTFVEISHDTETPQGSWTFGEGIVHHCAFDIESIDKQTEYKAHVEGMGYTDFSDRKDRGYFDSIYVRTPGGPLFEAAVTKPKAWAEDEDPAHIGEEIMISPQFEQEREQIIALIGKLDY